MKTMSQVFRACTEPDTDDFTSSGVWGKNDPREADPEEAKARFEEGEGAKITGPRLS